MPTNVLMPKWGLSMQEGTVLSWLKQQGEAVEKGEDLVEIESEKASNFVEAPASGVLARVIVPEGATVPVTTVIAVIAADGEEVGEISMAETPEQATGPAAGAASRGAIATGSSARVSVGGPPPREAPRRRVPASPAARRLAQQHGLDLAALRGSGPDGMIRVEDVEAAVAAAPTAGASPVTRVSFYSHGSKLDGVLYLPKSRPTAGPLPAVVFCLGFTYTKELLVPEMARRLAAEGFAGLIFDYRGFGKSEGPRGRVFPHEQVDDVKAAVTYLAQRPEIDARRIALAGISLGGSHAVYVAGTDSRVTAVAAISPVGDCRRWLRGTRPYWQWAEFRKRIEADRAARVLGRSGETVDAWDIVAPDPASRAFLDELYRQFPSLRCRLSLDSAAAIAEYCPERVVGAIAPRPLLLVHGEDDLLVPHDESRRLYRSANGPRGLEIIPEMGHFDWAVPGDRRFEQVMQTLSGWLVEQLQPARHDG